MTETLEQDVWLVGWFVFEKKNTLVGIGNFRK